MPGRVSIRLIIHTYLSSLSSCCKVDDFAALGLVAHASNKGKKGKATANQKDVKPFCHVFFFSVYKLYRKKMSNSPYIFNQKIHSIYHLRNKEVQPDENSMVHTIEFNEVYAVPGKSDGEGRLYMHGQQSETFIPSIPGCWAINVHDIRVNSTSNNYLALELSNGLTTCSFVRRDMLSTTQNVTERTDVGVICLHTKKFKKNTSVIVKVEGCRPLQNHLRGHYGNTCFIIRVWGIDFDNKPIHNEITAFLTNEGNENEYVTTLFSVKPFASIGDAWVYDKRTKTVLP